ncbi:MAG: lysophospholipid acyltransferase family protein [bacterium]|nr:lysophospholipid acyltransferase family protein [bacterium]
MRYREAGWVAPTYAVLRNFMGVRAKALGYDIEVKGRENVPMEGPVLFGPSHRSTKDPWLLALASHRPVFFMCKGELWTSQYAYIGYLTSLVGGFPVNRQNPGHSTIRRARGHLKKERAVGIFAEESRYEDEERKIVRGPEIGYLHRSIGRLAVWEKAPLVPVGIGVREGPSGWPHSKVARIVIAPALRPNPELPIREAEKQIMVDFAVSLQAAYDEASEAADVEASFS